MMKNVSEKEFQEVVIAYARTKGWLVHHCRPAQNRRGDWATHLAGDPGFPDLVLAKNGQVLFLELKSSSGIATDHQYRWHNMLDLPYDPVFRPVDWPDLKDLLG